MALIQCPECEKQISDQATACPGCGFPIEKKKKPTIKRVENQKKFTVTSKEDLSAQQGCLGVFVGSTIMWVAIVIGGLLTLTGAGALIGIPMIILGIIFLFVAPVFMGAQGKSARKGKCPYCFTDVTTMADAFDCPACNQRILVRENYFYQI